jgi:hypothetical protein
LSSAPKSLAAERLRSAFLRQVDRNQFGAADFLRELAIHARYCRDEVSPERALLAFVLQAVLTQWADELSGSPPPPMSVCDRLTRQFLPAVQECIECLASENGDPSKSAVGLVAAIPKED